jgi:hypothetical protein
MGAIGEVEKNDLKEALVSAISMRRTEGDQTKGKVQLSGRENYLVSERIDVDRKTIGLSLVLAAEESTGIF